MAKAQYLRIFNGDYHAVDHHCKYDRTKCGHEVFHDPGIAIFRVEDTEIAYFEEQKEKEVCKECIQIENHICKWTL